MDANRWARVEQLCHEALERREDQQAAFLDSACGADQELRSEVESLLVHRQRAETFIEAPAIQMAARALAGEQASNTSETSTRIGRVFSNYRVVEKVASGGMGDVYRAVRADGTYDKQVAIKLIQGARSTDFFLARFQNERQILADLDHPNIARLLDGGTTEEGLPYVVMEFIQGLPIDEFCKQKDVTVRDRLELFRTVCSAVHYAHQNLVVHRDLKPGNILVTSEGVPKLLDFGIAKILNPQRGEEFPQQTVTVMRLLTPDYASPEQLRNEPISTASDIYSLGVILYELLTGRSPYGVATEDSPQELMKAICDVEPEKPSTVAMGEHAPHQQDQKERSSSAPQQIGEKRRKLRKVLAGDLDNLVLKALKKEPLRRYSSVEQFSDDIRRYLVGMPVIAHEDSVAYRARKFVWRHKLGVAAAALLVLSLAGGLVATLWQARIARAERARAERRFNDVHALASSLIFEVHDSILPLQGATSARKLILERAQQYLDSLAQEARNDPALLRELAISYGRLASVLGDARGANLGNTSKAAENYRKAVDLGKSALSLQPDNAQLRRELATNYMSLSVASQNKDEKKTALREATMLLEPMVVNPQDLASQAGMAKVQELTAGLLLNEKDLNPALQAYEKSLTLYEALAKADPGKEEYRVEVSFAHKHVGGRLSQMNRLDEALEHYRQALAIDEAQLAAHPDDLNARFFITYTYSDTGLVLQKRGALDGALSYYRKALDIRAAMVAADPRDTRAQGGLGNTYAYISEVLKRKSNYIAALDAGKNSLRLRESLARNDPANKYLGLQVADVQGDIGKIYSDMAKVKNLPASQQIAACREARKWFDASLPVFRRMQKEGTLPSFYSDDITLMEKLKQECIAVSTPHRP